MKVELAKVSSRVDSGRGDESADVKVKVERLEREMATTNPWCGS